MKERYRIYTMHTKELEDPARFQEGLEEISDARREKIGRLANEQGKRLSLAAALLLDQGLRPYGLREKDLRERTGEHGKPYFPDEPGICFSLSHSGELAMAVFADTEVGCDLQKMRICTETGEARKEQKIAERFFTAGECAWIEETPIPLQRQIRFYRLWTLKESYAKACGLGLGRVIGNCEFLMEPAPALAGTKTDPAPGGIEADRGMEAEPAPAEMGRKNKGRYCFSEYSFGGYRAAVCLRASF